MHDAELLGSIQGGEKYAKSSFNSRAASNYIDFDSFDVSADSGVGKVSSGRLGNYIKKNYNVSVKRGSGSGGSGQYKVVFTAKKSKNTSRRKSPTGKRFNKRAKRPLDKFDANTKQAARTIVQYANYEEIISAADFFNN